MTLAKDGEKKATLPLLQKANDSFTWFKPDAMIAEKAYDKYEHYEVIVKYFDAELIVKQDTRQTSRL